MSAGWGLRLSLSSCGPLSRRRWSLSRRFLRTPFRAGPGRTILSRPSDQQGMVLLLVLWIVTLVSVVVLGWTQEWRTEVKLAANQREERQSRRLAEAGVYFALGRLLQAVSPGQAPLPAEAPPLWRADQSLHVLEMESGRAEVRVADEGGKINLNLANERILTNLFLALGLEKEEAASRVAAVSAWRGRQFQVSPFALPRPPIPQEGSRYLPKRQRFDTVEELAWLPGFAGSPLLPRLGQWLTVQEVSQGINLNTAPREVLQALGLGPQQIDELMLHRQAQAIRHLSQVPGFGQTPLSIMGQPLSFQNSPFYTIMATGIIKGGRARRTIKTIVRLDLGRPVPWEFLYWADDFPG
ncbi:MAG: general secretion pathway protein GspK [Deltaproteobacteria bacterium]|nr:general secretion pathway protein GspK [Deltaproteobacteria bacterium]